MAYFANGTEGLFYEERYCMRCIHYGAMGEACPILALHSAWNYDAVGKNKDKTKEIALDMLWPRDKDGSNGKCAMFFDAD